MKPKYKTILKVIVVLVIAVWLLSVIPFNQNIKQEIAANIYENGVLTGATTVLIDGEKSNYLFHDNEGFNGKFHIASYEKTGRKDMHAFIKWSDGENIQRLTYSQNGTFPAMDLVSTIIINDKMTQLALMFTDGTVMATSDEIYNLYIKHIFYDADTGSTSVEAANQIPKI